MTSVPPVAEPRSFVTGVEARMTNDTLLLTSAAEPVLDIPKETLDCVAPGSYEVGMTNVRDEYDAPVATGTTVVGVIGSDLPSTKTFDEVVNPEPQTDMRVVPSAFAEPGVIDMIEGFVAAGSTRSRAPLVTEPSVTLI